MSRFFSFPALFFLAILCIRPGASAQDGRTQYPKALSNAYFGLEIGYINYPFSNKNLAPGYTASSVKIPQPAVRLTLFGYRFNENLSARITYMRPTNWVEYRNINGSQGRHSVWMNVGGLTVKGQVPLAKKLSIYGEGGLGIITRSGFKIDEVQVVKDATYASYLAGGGLLYSLNKKWDLVANFTFTPRNKRENQPQTVFASGGFRYNMNPLPAARVERNAKSGYYFPKQMIQVGYSTNVLGYGVNKAVSEGPIPIFWGGDVVIRNGFNINYERNIFHTRKVFALDWGASLGYWNTRGEGTGFFSVSLYPVLRFNVLRTKPLDLYLYYSVAGPTYLSKVNMDGEDTGTNFTFRDFMGMGTYLGKSRKLNADISIGHFSNGNIYPQNPGVKIPLTFNLGYMF
ncbi:MAG TPA: acyloxyacyl hydrolase [Flavisolibacter sp.]|nr:acyloxyacyl hydrolase [Flavisolibacter sp.]